MPYFFQRTPACESGLPVNSTPAPSNAFLIASNVLKLLFGTPGSDSIFIIVEKPTPDISAKSLPDHLSNALAALI